MMIAVSIMTNMPSVRDATIEDIPAIFDIRISVRENGATRLQLEQLGINEETVRAAISTEGRGWIAEDEGNAVGFSIADLQEGSVFALYVRPEYEGRGFGGKLLAAAVEWLSCQGFNRVWLAVGMDTQAHRFYLKRGWTPTGRVELNGDIELELSLSGIRVRRMTEVEATPVVKLWHAAKKKAYTYLPLEQARTFDEDYAFFTQKILPHCEIWVAELEGSVRGFLAIDVSYIDRLYVSPDDQRKGIGSALIDQAKKFFPSGLELHTHQKNLAACRFYEKHGFLAVRFGTSPPPESEPDVEYHWRPVGI
jgi:ribosomal protein S18 acetylase RimI-like enzyme